MVMLAAGGWSRMADPAASVGVGGLVHGSGGEKAWRVPLVDALSWLFRSSSSGRWPWRLVNAFEQGASSSQGLDRGAGALFLLRRRRRWWALGGCGEDGGWNLREGGL